MYQGCRLPVAFRSQRNESLLTFHIIFLLFYWQLNLSYEQRALPILLLLGIPKTLPIGESVRQ